MKKILFFSPYWGRTGSELLLKECIMLLDAQKFECAIAGRNKGALYDSFPSSIRKFDFRSFNFEYKAETSSQLGKMSIDIARMWRRTYGKIYNRNLLYQFLDSVMLDFPADIWYINTINMPDILEYAEAHKIRTILHCHELEQMFIHVNKEQTKRIVDHPEHIITVASRNTALLETLGRKKHTVTIHPFIHLSKWNSDNAVREKVRNELGFNDKSFVWAMSGELDTNKDPMIFVEIAAAVDRDNPNANFMWLGGGHETGYSEYVKKRAEQLGLADRIFWTGPLKERYAEYFNAADGMMLTSHRDSFPLVMIEAAALGKPIVTFDSGGISEFLNNEKMGVIVKSRAVELFKQAMELVMTQPEKFEAEVSKKRAAEFDSVNKAMEWKKFMEQL